MRGFFIAGLVRQALSVGSLVFEMVVLVSWEARQGTCTETVYTSVTQTGRFVVKLDNMGAPLAAEVELEISLDCGV